MTPGKDLFVLFLCLIGVFGLALTVLTVFR